MQRALQQAQQEAERQRLRAEAATSGPAIVETGEAAAAEHEKPAALQNRSVLRVGRRTASVPIYRQLIERTGKRCVFVDTPSRAGLERAIVEIQDGRHVPMWL